MKDKNYHNRDIVWQKWEKVAVELNTSSEAAKTKWRGLRDTFCKECSKIPENGSGDEGGIMKESKWAYFKSMEFLKDQLQKRQLQGNVLSKTTFDEETQDSTNTFPPSPPDNEPESQIQPLESPQNTMNKTAPPQNLTAPGKKIAKMNNATAVQKLTMIEEQKIQMWKKRNSALQNDDQDYHFLMSLLPYLRKVPEERKMFVRTKLQQVFCKEDLLGSFRGQHTLQPIHHPRCNSGISPCGSMTSDSWSSTQVATPLSTHQEDLASFFSSVMPKDIN